MLTEEQQQIFRKSIRLAGWLAQQYRCPIGMDRDDWFQECCLCLMQAIEWHDESKGKLATLASKLVWNRQSCLMGLAKRQKNRARFVSLNAENPDGCSISEMIHDHRHQDSHETLEVHESFQKVMTGLDPRQTAICLGVSQGKSWREIGKGLKVSGEAVRQSFIRLRESINSKTKTNEIIKQCNLCNRTMIFNNPSSCRKFCMPCGIRRNRELGKIWSKKNSKKLGRKVAG